MITKYLRLLIVVSLSTVLLQATMIAEASGVDIRPEKQVPAPKSDFAADRKMESLTIDPVVKKKFDTLTAEWKQHLSNPGISLSSNSKTYTSDCAAYRAIVGLGIPAIPCIMELYLKPSTHEWWKNHNQWWQLALEEITGIGHNRIGWQFDKSKEYWADWWLWQQGKRDKCPRLDDYDPPIFSEPGKKSQ